jgi:hypothetical protein
MSNNNKMPSPCIGKNCKQKAGCPRHRLMEIEVDTVLNDVRKRLTSGEVNMNDFCKMWKNMRHGAYEVNLPKPAASNCNSTGPVPGPFSDGCFTASC